MKPLREYSERAATRFDEPRLSVAPLIDVCFLLIVYFLVTTTILPAEKDVSTEIPSPGVSPETFSALSIMVHVKADGAIVLNSGQGEIEMSNDSADHDLPELGGFLETVMVGVRELPPLLVRIDGEAQHQRVVDLMNLLQKIGWARVGFIDERDSDDGSPFGKSN